MHLALPEIELTHFSLPFTDSSEAQLIRNPSSRYSKSVAELAARYKWCLTGTPLVNSLNDAFPYLRFIGMPKYGERDGKNRIRRFFKDFTD